VRELLAVAGVSINQADEEGLTPLLIASKGGHGEVVQELLAADGVDRSNVFREYTALTIAKEVGHQAIVALLEE
jgi:ankyrin repeat protein